MNSAHDSVHGFNTRGDLLAGLTHNAKGGCRPPWEAILAHFDFVKMKRNMTYHYSQITSKLLKYRNLIGAKDLWIAASLAPGFPLVTKNVLHFGCVPGLKLPAYR